MRIAVSTRKGLFFFTRGKDGWSITGEHFVGVPVSATLHDSRDGALYAALNHGHFGPKLHRSDDGGSSWIEVTMPAFPPDTPDKPTLKQIWTLEIGRVPGEIWAGGIPAGLFRSTDKGVNWEFNAPLWNEPDRARWFGGGYDNSGLHSIVFDPRDERRILTGISSGGVRETRDGGKTWRTRTQGLYCVYAPPDQMGDPAMQDVHRMARCPAEPDTLWIQHHNGAFRSTDDAKTWTEIFPAVSNFGFVVAAHPLDGKTAWFVPAQSDEKRMAVDARLVVTRTRDGGATFETLSDGLPTIPSYDLVYRHGFAVDGAGKNLVMGSTTGGLWFSSNSGDSWTDAAVRLPPIYAVGFA